MKKVLLILIFTSYSLVAQTPIWHYTFDGVHTPVNNVGTNGPALLRLSGGIPTTANYGIDRFGNAGNSLICNDASANTVYETDLPNLPQGTSVRSFSFWVRYKSTGEQHVFKYGSNSLYNIFGMIKDGNTNSTVTYTSTGNMQNTSFTNPNYPCYISLNTNDNDAWLHYVVVVDSNLICHIYRNGVLLASNGIAANLNTIGTVLRFGAYDMTSMNSVNINFLLDDFKVYDVALTQTQIRDMYANETPYNGTNLVAYYGFENNLDCINNSVYNLTAQNSNENTYEIGVLGQSRKIMANPLYNNVIGSDINHSAATIMFWEKKNSNNANYSSSFELGSSLYARQFSGFYKLGYAYSTSGWIGEGSTVLYPFEWTHHAVTLKMINGSFHIVYYRNGELMCITGTNTVTNSIYTFIDKLVFGGGADGNGNLQSSKNITNANLDEAYIYNRVLSQPEILATMYRTTAPVLSNSDFELNEISLYPNPTNSVFNLEIPNEVVKQVEIYDLSGKKLLKSNQHQIDVSSFATGIYMVQIQTESGKTGVSKLIKK